VKSKNIQKENHESSPGETNACHNFLTTRPQSSNISTDRQTDRHMDN